MSAQRIQWSSRSSLFPGLFSGMLAISLSVSLTAHADHANKRGSPKLEEAEVHAKRLLLNLLREQSLTPGGVTVIDTDTLFQRNMPNLADMLRYALCAGRLVWQYLGGDGIFLSIRGSNLGATDYDMNGVKLLQDGLPITTADGNNHNRLIDPLSKRFATVARGANALTYGASTLCGAINFNSPTALNSAPLQLFANAGSHGRFIARATASHVFNNRLDGLLTIKRNNRDGYRDHSREEHEGVYSNGGWDFSNHGESRFYATYLNSKQDLRALCWRSAAAARSWPRSDLRLLRNGKKYGGGRRCASGQHGLLAYVVTGRARQ